LSPPLSYNILIDKAPPKEDIEKRLVLYYVRGKGWKVRITKGIFPRTLHDKIARAFIVAFREHLGKIRAEIRKLKKKRSKDND